MSFLGCIVIGDLFKVGKLRVKVREEGWEFRIWFG